MTMSGVWHVAFHVADLDRSVHFYRDVVGLQLVHRQKQANEYTRALVGYSDACLDVAQLALPGPRPASASGHDLELVEYVIPKAEPHRAERCSPGTAHLAFVVDDADAEYERLRGRGVHFVSAPVSITAGVNRGGKCCYFVDPDLITLELVQPPARV